jgi:hypothetical protein
VSLHCMYGAPVLQTLTREYAVQVCGSCQTLAGGFQPTRLLSCSSEGSLKIYINNNVRV